METEKFLGGLSPNTSFLHSTNQNLVFIKKQASSAIYIPKELVTKNHEFP
jgi:hypothetical protein